MPGINIICGKNEDVLKNFSDNHFHSIVTDPPYGLNFMNKKWDYSVPSVEQWREIYRVLKPGGYVLSFGGTRTYHRMVVNIEDAGFEIRDQLQWLYGQGFPKSLNVGDGYGTALKPANEPICLARKPLDAKTVKKNMDVHGTGAINVDASRIGYQNEEDFKSAIWGRGTNIIGGNYVGATHGDGRVNIIGNQNGRYPSNVILDEAAAAMLDEQSGTLKSGKMPIGGFVGTGNRNILGKYAFSELKPENTYGDSGGASRFFYVAKASRSEREEGLEGLEGTYVGGSNQANIQLAKGNVDFKSDSLKASGFSSISKVKNSHPTVKPIQLMRYLVRLITPSGGRCLDPWNGSGTTGIACQLEGFEYTGIEMEQKYCDLSLARIAARVDDVAAQLQLF